MDLYRQLADCIKLMDTSSVSYMRIKNEDFEFVISKTAISEETSSRTDTDRSADRAPSVVAAVPAAATGSASPAGTAGAQAPAAPAAVSTGSDAAIDPDLQIVRAPMLGTFYCAPEPGAAPFVAAGDHVTAGTTIGLLEAMKMFTAVPAGVDGTIDRIVATDGELVEFDMPIAFIRAQ